jgi:c-di-GMP-binding flagellar brake protein YcgR
MSPLEAAAARSVKIQIWEKLELEFRKGDKKGLYLARVEDIVPDGLMIDRPNWISGEPLFGPETAFVVSVFRQDGTYQYMGRIIRQYIVGARNYYIINRPENIYRYQRRDYVRISVCFPVHFRLLAPILKGEVEYDKAREYVGTSVNFSASGILIHTLKIVALNDLVVMNIIDKEFDFGFPVPAVVRRIIDLPEDKINAGLEFIISENLPRHLSENQVKTLPPEIFLFNEKKRQELVHYIFSYQVQLRKKGLM